MRVGETICSFVGDKISGENNSNTFNSKKNFGRNSIFAGDLNMQIDPIVQKRNEAREKALKIVGEAAANDRAIDDDLQERRNKINKLNEDMKYATKELKEIEDRKAKLKNDYGITEDSREQKDLELIEKRRDIFSGRIKGSLTKEDNERLAEIDKMEKTEYQRRALELDATGEPYREIVKNAEKGITRENAIIRGVNIERLKSNPVLDAVKEAEEIKAAASKEIMGMLIEEGKEHIEEEIKEKVEEAKEKKKEEEKEEERLEKIEERSELLEIDEDRETTIRKKKEVKVPINEILELNYNKIDIETEVNNIVDEMKLVIEDIKGTVVDSLL